jgi:hypothetical protein
VSLCEHVLHAVGRLQHTTSALVRLLTAFLEEHEPVDPELGYLRHGLLKTAADMRDLPTRFPAVLLSPGSAAAPGRYANSSPPPRGTGGS